MDTQTTIALADCVGKHAEAACQRYALQGEMISSNILSARVGPYLDAAKRPSVEKPYTVLSSIPCQNITERELTENSSWLEFSLEGLFLAEFNHAPKPFEFAEHFFRARLGGLWSWSARSMFSAAVLDRDIRAKIAYVGEQTGNNRKIGLVGRLDMIERGDGERNTMTSFPSIVIPGFETDKGVFDWESANRTLYAERGWGLRTMVKVKSH